MKISVGFSKDDLRDLAGPRSFERGQDYQDAVSGLEVEDGWFSARVQGTEVYEVEVAVREADGLSGACDCPYGEEGNFCKHCVAVGLVVLSRARDVPRQRSAAASRAEGLERWLVSLPREELLALVREQVEGDRELRHRLELRAATARSDDPVVRERILALLDPAPFAGYGYVECADAQAYGDQASEAVAALRTLIADGRAAQAVILAREAMALLCRTYGDIDDSSGYVGSVATELAEAHVEACRAARPDPLETAEWLARHLLDSDYDAFDTDPVEYREVLGTDGLARLRQLATGAWRRNPSGWDEKYLMERLLKAAGDVDELIAVYAADLSPTGETHLTIAQELEAAGRPDEALDWAERGLREMTVHHRGGSGLEDYLCERHAAAGRFARATAVRRDGFRVHRSLAAYRLLRECARAEGEWERERPAALELLREDAAHPRSAWGGGSVLIDALIDDGDLESAWQAATDGPAGTRQWLALADLIRDDRPADALPVYLRLIEPLKKITGNANYQQIARLLSGARVCHQNLGTSEQFADYVTSLRSEQKRKRNLMKILDQHDL
ncbi:SWIM zinc finger domain-containing protein [Streptomyces sp. NPDC088725]|uniref:SWIM zinc finger family protein n=1 Tax=Streptomyces sp. NPDC088725 TaxID=3365873 RepID=UPI0037FEEFDC